MRDRPAAFRLDLAVKLSLVLLLAFGAFSGLERFAGKAFGWRLVGYSVAALLVPAIWATRGRRQPYPYVVDTLFVTPFLIDTIGNAQNLYDTIDWWDDANHFVNWAILVAGFTQLLLRLRLGPVNIAALAIGFGAVTAVLWEFMEYYTFIRHSKEVRTAYTDTLGDLALGLSGSVLAAVLSVALVRRRTRPR